MKMQDAFKVGVGIAGGAALAFIGIAIAGPIFMSAAPSAIGPVAQRSPVNVLDEAVTLSEQQYQAFTYDFSPGQRSLGMRLSVEVTNVGGTPMDTYVMDRTNYLRLEAGSNYSYLGGVSQQGIAGSFQSEWFQPAEDGLLYIVLRPVDVQDGSWTDSSARVVLRLR